MNNLWCLLLLLLVVGQAEAKPKSAVQFINAWSVCPSLEFLPKSGHSNLTCHQTQLPEPWEAVIPDYNGYAVYHNQFTIIKKNQNLDFFVEQIRDADKVFVNGQLIGEMGAFPPNFDKAVLYSRAYPIPPKLLKQNEPNEINVWVYNDARTGGFANGAPVIATHADVLKEISDNKFWALSIMVALLIIGIMHLIHYVFNRSLLPNLSFGLFSLGWVAYLWTYSDFAVNSGLSMNVLFKLNVVLFFTIFTLFPLFILQFFNVRMPKPLKVILYLTVLAIPVVILLPQPGWVYIPLQLIEILAIPTILSILWVFHRAIKKQRPYAKLMVSVLAVYIVFGSADIWMDFFQVVNEEKQHLLGPWALLLLSLVVTMILAHKNRINQDQAQTDSLTQTLRLHFFTQQLTDLKMHAQIKGSHLLVMMLDLDDFKLINDQLGHTEGNHVLQSVAASMKRILKDPDLLGRYGGDEFCIACELENISTAKQRINYIHLASQQPTIRLNHKTQQLRTTLGFYISPPNDELNSQQLIQKADQQLVAGKSEEKGGIFGKFLI